MLQLDKATDIKINNKEVQSVWLNNTKIWDRSSLG